MVFLGLEQPVAYGRQLVFDPTTALMVLNANRDYINAVYNDYQLARQDMKDFLKEYGDFLSPILADMDWYEKNISGDIRNFVNSMYELGIDPLRSQEGRALVARKLASLPVQLMSLKRQAAEAAREYVKNRDAMIKAGMWNEDYERHMLGGLTLEEWDNSLGAWKATSASPYMDYEKKYGHLFDKMDYEYDQEESKKHPGMIVMTKNKNRMHDILSASRPDMANDPQYKYDLERIKAANPGISDSDAKGILENEIVNRNYKGGMKMEADPIYMADLKYKQAMSLAAMRGNRKSDKGGDNEEADAPTTFMDRLRRNINWNFQNKQTGPDSAVNTLNSIVEYWDKMMKSVEGQGKVTGQKDVDVPVSRGVVTPSPYGAGPSSFSISKTNIVTEKGKRDVYDLSNNALYKKYAYEKTRWSNFASGNYYPSKYDKTMMPDGKTPAYKEINRILKKGKDATPEELRLLDAYMKQDFQRMWMDANSSSPKWSGLGTQRKGTMATKDAKKRASDMWDAFSAEGLGGIQNKVLHQRFVGATNTLKDPDLENGYYRVRFGSGYHYAPVRLLNVTGNARFKYNDIHSKFDRFLSGQIGISTDENDVKAAGMPAKGRLGMQLDILSHPLLSKEAIQDFYNSLSYSEKLKYPNIDALAKQLGLRARNEKIKYRDKNEELHSSDTYYEVPVIRTVDNSGGLNFRDINALSDILEFNAGVADKNILNSENLAFMEDLPVELATSYILE